MEGNQPIWVGVGVVIVGLLVKVLDSIGVKEWISKKTGADKNCKKEVARLKIIIVKMDTGFKLIAQFMNNPENSIQLKESIEKILEEIAPTISQIDKENQVVSKDD
jgi:hypothetical protein